MLLYSLNKYEIYCFLLRNKTPYFFIFLFFFIFNKYFKFYCNNYAYYNNQTSSNLPANNVVHCNPLVFFPFVPVRIMKKNVTSIIRFFLIVHTFIFLSDFPSLNICGSNFITLVICRHFLIHKIFSISYYPLS